MSGCHEHKEDKLIREVGNRWCRIKEKKGGDEGMDLKMGQRRKEVRRGKCEAG